VCCSKGRIAMGSVLMQGADFWIVCGPSTFSAS
jgi:hypothetical protein